MCNLRPPPHAHAPQIKSKIPPASERKKLIPLGSMFFFILFNYTILRDTKDVLMVTAKKSGAEVIPFIKTYVNLPVRFVRCGMLCMIIYYMRVWYEVHCNASSPNSSPLPSFHA